MFFFYVEDPRRNGSSFLCFPGCVSVLLLPLLSPAALKQFLFPQLWCYLATLCSPQRNVKGAQQPPPVLQVYFWSSTSLLMSHQSADARTHMHPSRRCPGLDLLWLLWGNFSTFSLTLFSCTWTGFLHKLLHFSLPQIQRAWSGSGHKLTFMKHQLHIFTTTISSHLPNLKMNQGYLSGGFQGNFEV